MKIGILTFNCALNYGATLQMFALQKTINDINPKAVVEIINYRPTYFKKALSAYNIRNKNFFIKLLKILNLNKRKSAFKRFQKNNTKISIEEYDEKTLRKIQNKYDIVICGSDQVWNTVLTYNDSNFFLPFLKAKNKATYSVSMGSDIIELDKKTHIRKQINDFREISVRESYLITQLSSQGLDPQRIRQDIDPVLLANKKIWTSFMNKKAKSNYILVFEVMPSKELLNEAKTLAHSKNLKVHYIGPYINMRGIKYIASPSFNKLFCEFCNAKYVFSNSYHGTLLSIINKKQFYSKCDLSINNGGRIADILRKLNLIERAQIERIDDYIDWKEFNNTISLLRSDSLNYLRGVINCI